MEMLVVLILNGIPLLILVLVLYLLASTHKRVKRIEERLDRQAAEPVTSASRHS